MQLPKSLRKLIESFEKLPGIGPRTAQRLTIMLLNFPQAELDTFAGALTNLKSQTKFCSRCKNLSEEDICSVCSDPSRDINKIMVVSNFFDTIAMEKTGYKGLYHVLGGVIDPLNNIGPDELFIDDFIRRVGDYFNDPFGSTLEIIIATGTNMVGESTAMYLSRLIREGRFDNSRIKVTRIARGIPVGGDIEYADDVTLSRALEGRADF